MEHPKSIVNINETKLPLPATSKPRPLTSKLPSQKNHPIKSKPNIPKSRPKSILNPKILNNLNNQSNKIPIINYIQNEHFNPNNNQNANMDFRTIRPTSNYQNSIFNIYWESIANEPKSGLFL